jgi:hypothetical protein
MSKFELNLLGFVVLLFIGVNIAVGAQPARTINVQLDVLQPSGVTLQLNCTLEPASLRYDVAPTDRVRLAVDCQSIMSDGFEGAP